MNGVKRGARKLYFNVSADSYMRPEEDLLVGEFRLLETDYILVLPAKIVVRLIFTGADVIHSWAVPSLGIKTDCIPGRLNQSSVYITQKAQMYGQCSELCGLNHGFMPIMVASV